VEARLLEAYEAQSLLLIHQAVKSASVGCAGDKDPFVRQLTPATWALLRFPCHPLVDLFER
jgi:hypothetical protein